MQTQPRRISISFNRLLGTMALLFAVCSVSLPVHASLIFEYSFTDPGNGGIVTGKIYGLVANGDDQQAQSVTVEQATFVQNTTFPLIFFPSTNPAFNIFDVQSGAITDISYNSSYIYTNGLGQQVFGNIVLAQQFSVFRLSNITTGQAFGLGNHTEGASFATFSEVPEPSLPALLLSGVIAFGVLRGKKRKVAE